MPETEFATKHVCNISNPICLEQGHYADQFRKVAQPTEVAEDRAAREVAGSQPEGQALRRQCTTCYMVSDAICDNGANFNTFGIHQKIGGRCNSDQCEGQPRQFFLLSVRGRLIQPRREKPGLTSDRTAITIACKTCHQEQMIRMDTVPAALREMPAQCGFCGGITVHGLVSKQQPVRGKA
jgi:hypothetical protein